VGNALAWAASAASLTYYRKLEELFLDGCSGFTARGMEDTSFGHFS
jgi:hypothetical protein